MSVVAKLLLVSALLAQVCAARPVHSHIAKHTAVLNQQMKSLINPSGIIPTAPAPYPEPVNGTGWVYLTNSYNSDCSAPFLSYGVPVGQCIVESNYAYKYNVVDDSCNGGVISYYLDTACTIRTGNTDLETFTNNCTRAENPKIDDEAAPIYMMFDCTNRTEVPRTSDAGAVITMTYEATETCNSKAAHEYIAFNNDLCINIDDDFSFISSCDHGQPIYSAAEEGASTCAGPLHADPLPTECMIDTEIDDNDDDGLYVPSFLNPPPTVSTTAFPTPVYTPLNGSQQFSCQESLVPSAEPSQEPTAAPTLRPTTKPTVRHTAYPTAAAPTVATFYASQIFNGISYTTYSTNMPLYSSTFIQTIAASMINVPTSAITKFTVTSTTPDPHGHTSFFNVFAVSQNNVRQAGQVALSLRRLDSDAIASTYTVSLESIYTAEQLASQLDNSVTSGAFDSTLHSLAVTNSATALTTVSSGETIVTYPPTDNDDNNSDEGLSDGAIAGIVIGAVAGVVIIALLVYFFACNSKAGLLSNQHPHVEL